MKYAFINRHKRVWPISVQCTLASDLARKKQPQIALWPLGAIAVKSPRRRRAMKAAF